MKISVKTVKGEKIFLEVESSSKIEKVK